jgi:cytosine/adenosine deaminase-related metal-dependent hydrolase
MMSQRGYVNAHTHLYSALSSLGMPAPREAPTTFTQILERVWWRLDRALDPASLRAAARLYAAEALLAGTTTLVDHNESPGFIDGSLDVLADACTELGIRAVVCFGATERNGGRDEARRGLAECARFVRTNRRPLVRGLVGLHASFTVSDATVREAGALARELFTEVHVHLAEAEVDVADARARGHAGPLERLLTLDALPPKSILAHGVHLSPAQVALAESRGLWLVQNPRSNAHNRVGWAGSLSASARVALGTDGFPADMRAEYAELVKLARENGDLAGEEVLRARLHSGLLLVEKLFHGNEAPDDTVEWSEPGPGGRARAVRVAVAGRPVVENGALVHGDLEAIRAEAREQAGRLWARMEALP